MGAVDYVIVAVIVLLLVLAAGYIVREKKKGKKCIGCPGSSSCVHSGSCTSCCGCGKHEI